VTALRRAAPGAAVAVAAGAVVAAVFGAHGFLNYDTEYALVWGRDLARLVAPDYGVRLAPTPHPLANLAGLLLAPLTVSGAVPQGTGAEAVVEVLAYLWLGVLAWLVFRLGAVWFGAPAGVLAAVVFLTREPVLSNGVRAYVDVPYLCLVLAALLREARRPRDGTGVLALLAVAGLLRPEAWLFSGAYLAWLWWPARRATPRLGVLAALAAAAPLLWLLSDLIVAGDPLHSLTGTRETAGELRRVTGLDDVPGTMPRRLGEILREPVLVGAAGGGLIALAWRRERALLPAAAGIAAIVAFCVLALAGLPIITRYLLLPAAILVVFCGAGALGWTQLPRGHPRRVPWMAFGALVLVLLAAFAPSQARRLDRLTDAIAIQEGILGDLRALTPQPVDGACVPVALPNQRAAPNLALWLDLPPRDVVSARDAVPRRGVYMRPSSGRVARRFVLDRRDLDQRVPPAPRAFRRAGGNASWRVYERGCAR